MTWKPPGLQEPLADGQAVSTAPSAVPDTPAPAEKALARHASGEISVVPIATTVQELPKEGALAAAQVAPATGPINAVPGTPVIGVLQSFLKNRTVQLCLLAIGLGLAKSGKVFWDVMGEALRSGRHFFQIEWQETFYDSVDGAIIFVVPAIIGIIVKVLDNNFVNLPQFLGKKLSGDPTKSSASMRAFNSNGTVQK